MKGCPYGQHYIVKFDELRLYHHLGIIFIRHYRKDHHSIDLAFRKIFLSVSIVAFIFDISVPSVSCYWFIFNNKIARHTSFTVKLIQITVLHEISFGPVNIYYNRLSINSGLYIGTRVNIIKHRY